jgi:hypothetical protein
MDKIYSSPDIFKAAPALDAEGASKHSAGQNIHVVLLLFVFVREKSGERKSALNRSVL